MSTPTLPKAPTADVVIGRVPFDAVEQSSSVDTAANDLVELVVPRSAISDVIQALRGTISVSLTNSADPSLSPEVRKHYLEKCDTLLGVSEQLSAARLHGLRPSPIPVLSDPNKA